MYVHLGIFCWMWFIYPSLTCLRFDSKLAATLPVVDNFLVTSSGSSSRGTTVSKESTPEVMSSRKPPPRDRNEAIAREVNGCETKTLFDDDQERMREEARSRAQKMSDQQLGITRTPSKREKGDKSTIITKLIY